ncbi:MAG: type II toxin-antitoxin system VapB family antitoxin [Spirochaetia bacterium]|nr:type II toxin-antitoxin system VapB family antitoxin [Spirochaetia bacterium]
MRTTLELPDDLIRDAMIITQAKTKNSINNNGSGKYYKTGKIE